MQRKMNAKNFSKIIWRDQGTCRATGMSGGEGGGEEEGGGCGGAAEWSGSGWLRPFSLTCSLTLLNKMLNEEDREGHYELVAVESPSKNWRR